MNARGILCFLLTLSLAVLSFSPAAAQPSVVPTGEGQIGGNPNAGDKLIGFTWAPSPDAPTVIGGLLTFPNVQPPELSYFTDDLHGIPNPVPLDSRSGTYTGVAPVRPASAEWIGGNDIAGVFAGTEDGTTSGTQSVVVAIVPTIPGMSDFVVLDGIPTLVNPDLNDVGVAADNQGRITVAYTALDMGVGKIKAQQIDGLTSLLIGGTIDVSNEGADPDVALLAPDGKRLIIASTKFSGIRGNIVDFSGAMPVVEPGFDVQSTAAPINFTPAVAAGVAGFTVAWESVALAPGDVSNIRARRFDAMGNPIGGDFVVNTTTAGSQGQASVARKSGQAEVVVWAGDGEALDVFAQVYDAAGNPIGGEIPVNTTTAGTQDQPYVGFLPQVDAQGRPQFVVTWRDTAQSDGTQPNGTGTSYRCFSIDGLAPPEIFADGFESGDVTSWSGKVP